MEKTKFYIASQSAEDSHVQIVELTEAEHAAVSKFLNMINDNDSQYCGRTAISETGYDSYEDAFRAFRKR